MTGDREPVVDRSGPEHPWLFWSLLAVASLLACALREEEIAGRVERVLVKEGQRVKKGQKLATLDDREYRVALEEAKARYLQGLGQLAVEEEGYDSKTAERSLEEETTALRKLEAVTTFLTVLGSYPIGRTGLS